MARISFIFSKSKTSVGCDFGEMFAQSLPLPTLGTTVGSPGLINDGAIVEYLARLYASHSA